MFNYRKVWNSVVEIVLTDPPKSGARPRTQVRFASFLSGGFTTMAVMNPPERKHLCSRPPPGGVDYAYHIPTGSPGFSNPHKMQSMVSWKILAQNNSRFRIPRKMVLYIKSIKGVKRWGVGSNLAVYIQTYNEKHFDSGFSYSICSIFTRQWR